MKDYYYILGLKENSSSEEIKKAYRKLSLKFHPDKNNGDEFFSERFKEIQQAYETLSNPIFRDEFDKSWQQKFNTSNNINNNFYPIIDYFRTDNSYFEFDKTVTFYWQTFNTDKVMIKPFGSVDVSGSSKYKIKDIKNKVVKFELVAYNSFINKSVIKTITLTNKTYVDLEQNIIKNIKTESQYKTEFENNKRTYDNNSKSKSEDELKTPNYQEENLGSTWSLFSGTEYISNIKFQSGNSGKIFLVKNSNHYRINCKNNNVFYSTKNSVINALYYFIVKGKILEYNRVHL